MNITSIHQRPSFDEFPRHSTYFFNVISLIEKSTAFPHTFFDLIWMVEKSTLFPQTFFDVISLVKKSMLFSLTLFHVILMVEKTTLFACIFFDEISTLFLVKLQANENNRRSFPLLVTLKNWLLQDFSLNFSSKSHSCSPSRTIFESYNLQHYKRELPHISFLGIYRTITLYNFWVVTLLWSHSCKKVQ